MNIEHLVLIVYLAVVLALLCAVVADREGGAR